MIHVIIADDHAVVRKGLRQILEETREIAVVDEADSGMDVLNKVRTKECDVVVLDIAMPGMHGLDVLKQIKNEHPSLPVLILSIYPEEQYAVRVLKAGASGYLCKESAPEELVTAIRRVSSGRKYITETLAEQLATEVEMDTEKRPHEILSDREYQVLCLIASGRRMTDIASELSLSVKTVSTYRTRILEKMGMKTNAELTHYAFKHGLVE